MANGFESSELISDIPVELYEAYASALEKVADKMDVVSLASSEAARGVSMLNEAVGESSLDMSKVVKDGSDYNAVLAEMSKQLSSLNGSLANIEQAMKGYQSALQGANVTTRKGREETDNYALKVMRLTSVYQQLGLQVGGMQEAIQALAKKEKDYQRVMSSVEQLRNSRIAGLKEEEQTYNSNSQQYTILKALVNELTAAEREGNAAAKEAVEMARKKMETMNQMQIATGKYSLQVGNYSKAMNGLSFSMAQVVRETPTLFNSVQQFAMAISNNIPILVDNIKSYSSVNKAAKEELESLTAKGLSEAQAMEQMGSRALNLTSTTKALAASLLSLNTIVVALTLAFQLIAKAIDKKKKAQEALKTETKDYLSFARQMIAAEGELEKAAVKETAKLKILYGIMRDVNRSQEERAAAAGKLTELTTIEINSYDDRCEAIERYIRKLDQEARARAKMNILERKYEELESVRISREDAVRKYLEGRADDIRALNAQEKELKKSLASAALFPDRQKMIKTSIEQTKEARRKIFEDDTKDIVNSYKKQEAEVRAAIKAIRGGIGLLDIEAIETGKKDEKGGKGITTRVEELEDYYWEAQEAIIKVTKEGKEREIALAKLGMEKEIAELEGYKEKAEGIQKDYLDRVIEARKKAYLDDVKAIDTKYYKQELDNQSKLMAALSDDTDKIYKEELEGLNAQYQLDRANARARISSRKDLFEELKRIEIEYWSWVKATALANGDKDLADKAEASIRNAAANVYRQMKRKSNAPKNIVELLFATGKRTGFKDDTTKTWAVREEYQDFVSAINSSLSTSIQYMNEWISTRIEMAQVAVEAAQKEADAAKSTLDAEVTARANGYASNVQMARQEWEEKKRLEREAVQEQKKLQKVQEAINTAQQISALITGTANIWSTAGLLSVAGPGWAAAATALMWSSFLASKAAALKLMNTENYGEGMSEYLDYGGSHASGNDIDFGVKKDGTRRRVERGEMVAVINKRNVRKYGAGNLSDIISSINKGTFGTNYGNTYASLPIGGSGADLTSLESDVRAIKEQGEKRVMYNNGKKVEIYKNSTKIYS